MFQFFTSTFSINAFLHLWSLSVEIQFYLLVPFIFLGLQYLKNDYQRFVVVSLITLFGYIAFAMAMDKFAFNFMLLRLWQFSAGFMAVFWNRMRVNMCPKEKEKPGNHIIGHSNSNNDIFTLSLSILGLCLLPNQNNVLILRPLITMCTAFIIASEINNYQILSSKLLGYIGDISYVLYLVHWPIIAIFQPYNIQDYVFVTAATFLSSMFLHHVYEKKYLKLNSKNLTILLLTLMFGNAFLQYSIRNHTIWNKTYSGDLQEKIDANKAQLPFSWMHDLSDHECSEKKILEDSVLEENNLGCGTCMRGNGSISMMMLGNSYVMSLKNYIRDQFHYNYSDFHFCSIGGGNGFYMDSPASQRAINFYQREVELHKPDVLFLLSRHPPPMKDPIEHNKRDIEQMNKNIKYYEKFVKKIYILGAHPLYQHSFVDFFLQNVINRPEVPETLHLDRRAADNEMKFVRKRLSMVECEKCEIFELTPAFLYADKYLTFDEEESISYVDNTGHLTSAGLKLCDPILKNITKEIMRTI
ncbi:hypothetical protein B9Z55_017456 [Caenorhabditis nigoni]|uniref:SGNH domain-containing protein n=1 Tax=Caenorhabditis nigoni TaxID=1611254 RepID=A0A2G5T977_9PELO|nr:hypothetical protein B9Z55_017456 [Caenorhabditis nigoni]